MVPLDVNEDIILAYIYTVFVIRGTVQINPAYNLNNVTSKSSKCNFTCLGGCFNGIIDINSEDNVVLVHILELAVTTAILTSASSLFMSLLEEVVGKFNLD